MTSEGQSAAAALNKATKGRESATNEVRALPFLTSSPAIASGRLLADLSRRGFRQGKGDHFNNFGGLSEQEEWAYFSLSLFLSLSFSLSLSLSLFLSLGLSSFPQASL